MTWDFQTLPGWISKPRSAIVGDRAAVGDGRGVLIHRDYGSDVLLVAHTDWVGEPLDGAVDAPRVRNGSRIAHPALDDRLGCWAIEQLWAAGVRCDLLYTDCEEIGFSTAADFSPPRPYKFILSFDRAGVDSVLYRYETAAAWRRFAGRHIGPIGDGTYSCIAAMDLGVCGINVGVGYFEHNSARCWADLRLTAAQLDRAVCFIGRARHRVWEYEPRISSRMADCIAAFDIGDDGLANVTQYRAVSAVGGDRFDYWDTRGRRYQGGRHRYNSAGRSAAAVLADCGDDFADVPRAAVRCCIACGYAAGEPHHCPMVADCYCCNATDELESRYDFGIR